MISHQQKSVSSAAAERFFCSSHSCLCRAPTERYLRKYLVMNEREIFLEIIGRTTGAQSWTFSTYEKPGQMIPLACSQESVEKPGFGQAVQKGPSARRAKDEERGIHRSMSIDEPCSATQQMGLFQQPVRKLFLVYAETIA